MLERIILVLFPILVSACPAGEGHAPAAKAPAAKAPVAVGAKADLPPEARAAYERLRAADRFVDSMVGFDGDLPPEAIDLRALARADPRGEACAQLLREAGPAGQLLALCGLWWRDPARFDAGVAALRKNDTLVAVHQGCVIAHEPMRDVVQRANAIRLVDRKQTIAEWIRANGGQSGRLDIAGGSYPRRLLGLE
jgi:hypothetical protein